VSKIKIILPAVGFMLKYASEERMKIFCLMPIAYCQRHFNFSPVWIQTSIKPHSHRLGDEHRDAIMTNTFIRIVRMT